jgi:hypothetical protein
VAELQIVCKVATVVDPFCIALNMGSDHGVTEGMEFRVSAPGTLSITDPDSGEILGEIEPRLRVYARVQTVYQRCCLCAIETRGPQPQVGDTARLVSRG